LSRLLGRGIADFGAAAVCGTWRAYLLAHKAPRIPILVHRRMTPMLWTIFVVLLVLWALGMVSSYTLGGFIHLLLLIAIAVVLIRVIQGRRPI